MNYRKKVLKLAEFLIENQLEKEAAELLSLLHKKSDVTEPDINDWLAVAKEIESDHYDPALQTTIAYFKTGYEQLVSASNKLKGASKDELGETLNSVPRNRIASVLSTNNLIKFANIKNKDYMVRTAEICYSEGLIAERPNYKVAGWWDTVKLVGNPALRYGLPLISWLFAMKNFYYCAVSYSKLMSEMPEIGLAWYDAMHPEKLQETSEQNKDLPNSLTKIARATKTSRVLADEFISLIANTIDGIKDIIFAVIDVLSAGWMIAVDIGISFFIMAYEWKKEDQILEKYDEIISYISETAREAIIEFRMTEFSETSSYEPSERMTELEEAVLKLSEDA